MYMSLWYVRWREHMYIFHMSRWHKMNMIMKDISAQAAFLLLLWRLCTSTIQLSINHITLHMMLSDTAKKKNKDYSTLSRSSCSFADCLYSKNSSNAPHSIAGERLFFRLLLTIFPFSPYEKYNVLVTPVMCQLSIGSLLSYWMAKPYSRVS